MISPLSIFFQGLVSANFAHLDLIAVGVSIAAIATLGFAVFFSDQKSTTNRAFLWFAVATIAYGTANYFSYQVTDPWQALWLLRLTLFTAVWHAFSFFSLFYVFPRKNMVLPQWYVFGAVPVAILGSLITLTNLVFSHVSAVTVAGQVVNPERGPGIAVFGMVAVIFVAGGLIELFKKTLWGPELEKKQSRVVMVGAVLTFTLILTFNFVLPVFWDVLTYIPLAPLFFLPFIVFTSHAIQKYKLLNIKIIATELFTFALAIITLVDLIFANSLQILLLRIGTSALVLGFGILLNRSVIHEVQQREQLHTLTLTLQDTNKRLVELDHLKSQFLSFASHQLKSPLTSIKWQSEMIADGSLGAVPKEVTDASLNMVKGVDRLVTLVNEFLNLRKIEEGKLEYTFATINIPALVEQVVHDIQPLATHKGLALTFTDEAHHRMASADTSQFTQVIQNLVDNAIKYTEKGSVSVTVKNDTPRSIMVTITDTGHGMEPDLIPNLFEEFRRASGPTKRIEGTGLGLYIAKQIVIAHKGTIRVTSPGPGKGSSFIVSIPSA